MSEDKLDDIKDAVERMERALVGDEKMGSTGIIHRVKDLEKKTAYQGRIITWVTMAWTIIVGGLLYFKSHIAESIVSKIN